MIVDLEEAASGDLRLAEALIALGNPARLALLRQLRTPKALREIRIKPGHPGGSEGSPDRNLTRQTVKTHLEKLQEIGVVIAREAERDYGPTVEYVVNHQALFALSEEFRALAKLRAAAELDLRTIEGRPVPSADLQGPSLVLVRGLDEGRVFSLAPPASEWVIGRRRGLAVSLDFDPFVSTEHAVVTREGGSLVVRDLPDNRNGTFVNFRPLPKGARQVLTSGDIVGVGRTLLVFKAK